MRLLLDNRRKRNKNDGATSLRRFFTYFHRCRQTTFFCGSSEEVLMIWNSSLPQNSNLQTLKIQDTMEYLKTKTAAQLFKTKIQNQHDSFHFEFLCAAHHRANLDPRSWFFSGFQRSGREVGELQKTCCDEVRLAIQRC